MDDLTYAYNGNQLQSVTDIAESTGFLDGNTSSTDYVYDLNGNLEIDRNKGITSISYNHLNLPTEIVFDNDQNKKIEYSYNAVGTKLKKVITNGGNLTTTDYVSGYLYENNQLQFFPHSEGYVELDGNDWNYVYNYLDHLGNVRLSYTDADGNGSIDPANEIIKETNHYPFGLTHKGYNGNVSALGNSAAKKWQFGGKEYNEEFGLNWYDYGFRNYQADLGRWMNIDPLAEAYTNTSAYAYVDNNPVFFVDPDGLRIDVGNIFDKDEDGNFIHQELAEAFTLFAKSDVGNKILSKFAEGGQEIGLADGSTLSFKESGEFDSQGIDLAFQATNLNEAKGGEGAVSDERNDSGPNGQTGAVGGIGNLERRGKGTIVVRANSALNTSEERGNEFARAFKKNPKDPMTRNLFILSRTLTFFHETIVHADSFASDLTDNCLIDCSNIPNSGFTGSNFSKTQHNAAKSEGSLFISKAIPALQKIFRDKGINRTQSQLKKQAKKGL